MTRRRQYKKGPMCWLCNGPLTASGRLVYEIIELPNQTQVKVHKACVKDARALASESSSAFPAHYTVKP